MIILDLLRQTGKSSPKFRLTPTSDLEKAILDAVIQDSETLGKDVVLLEHTHENTDNAFIKTMTFGLSPDPTQTGITANAVYPTFFEADRTYWMITVYNRGAGAVTVNGGTTAGGTELFSDETVTAGQRKAILISLSPTVATAFYIHSTDWNSCTVDIKAYSDEA